MYNKDFFASKTTWGALFLLLNPALQAIGIQIDTEGVVDGIVNVIGLVIFLWGQFTRKSEITTFAGLPIKRAGGGVGMAAWVGLLAGLVLMMTGCGLLPKDPPKTAQEVINEVKVLLIAAQKQVAENVRMGVMTDTERDDTVRRLDTYKADLKVAEDLLAIGNLSEAEQRARVINTLVTELYKQVAAKSKRSDTLLSMRRMALLHQWSRTGWPVFAFSG